MSYNRFTRLAADILAKGKVKSWRHVSSSWGSSYRDVSSIDIPAPAIRTGNNTWAYFYDDAKSIVSIQYHRTDIIHLHVDGMVVVWSDYNTVSTKARYRDYGIRAHSDRGEELLSTPFGTYPIQRGMIASLPEGHPSLADKETLEALRIGARIGDVDANDAIVRILRKHELFYMAHAVASLRGRTWGRKQRDGKREWDELAEPIGDRWLAILIRWNYRDA